MTTHVHSPTAQFFRRTPAKRGSWWSLFSHLKQHLLPDRRQPQFVSGHWDLLAEPASDLRLGACAHLLRSHTRHADVLELGCDEAQLQRLLTPVDYATWLGVDVSAGAVHRAQRFANQRVRYLAANPNTLELECRYDAIIFSQPIYYLPDPVALLRRHARHLKPDGIFIFSLFENGTQAPVWREIQSVAYTIGSRVIENERGIWTCEAVRMRRNDWHTAVEDGLL